MVKKILLVLDSSPPGIKAQAYALKIAAQHHASLTGLGILDTPWIAATKSEPLGGTVVFNLQGDEIVTLHTQKQLNELQNEFNQKCKVANVRAFSQISEGFPVIEIEKLAQEHDLIVMGKTSDLHFDLDEDSDEIVKHVAKDNPRPMILVPEDYDSDQGDIMVAYDGSLQAARALHMFLLLKLGNKKNIHIVSCDKLADKASIIAKRAQAICQAHGYNTTIYNSTITGSHTDQLLQAITYLKPSLLVMGGFSHTIVHEALFGSSTKTLMKESPVPLFIHH